MKSALISSTQIARHMHNQMPPNDVGMWMAAGASPRGVIFNGERGELMKIVEENAVIVFARRGCCMSCVVRRLLQLLGANPAVHEVEEDDAVDDMVGQLAAAAEGGGKRGFVQFPAVFIGGKWFGGLERIIATHIKEELTPLLRQAGALWL